MERKKYEDLTFADNFMFCKVLSTNKDLCKRLIELILDVKIKDINIPKSENVIEILNDSKGIRLDVYVDDDQGTVYDLEMQTCDYKDIALRSRYYQALIDLNTMERGSKYSELKPNFIIFICLNDPFEANLPVYIFENICRQNNSIKLNDGAIKVFLNSKGNAAYISDEMRNLFDLLNGKNVNDNYSLAYNLEKAVYEAKEHYMWREEYKSMINVIDFERMEAREEGFLEGKAEGKAEGLKLAFENEIKNLLNRGKTPEEIADFTGHNLEEIKRIAENNKA